MEPADSAAGAAASDETVPASADRSRRPKASYAVVAIFGPTGVGKTAVATELAGALRARGEDPLAVSADALQVYDGLGTLTGVAGPEERERLEHRLIGFVPVSESFSVGAFAKHAHSEIDAALARGRLPIVVGGTGLYLRAALTDLDLRPSAPEGSRRRLEEQMEDRGPAALHAELAARAPRAADAVDPADRSRIVRALELDELGALQERAAPSQLWSEETRHPTLLVGLVMEREALYRRIDARVEAIVAAGAEHEVRRAAAEGASRTARKAVGFEELLAGDVEAMKRSSRRYAKRQLTWMRKLAGVVEIDVTGRARAEVAWEIAQLAT